MTARDDKNDEEKFITEFCERWADFKDTALQPMSNFGRLSRNILFLREQLGQAQERVKPMQPLIDKMLEIEKRYAPSHVAPIETSSKEKVDNSFDRTVPSTTARREKAVLTAWNALSEQLEREFGLSSVEVANITAMADAIDALNAAPQEIGAELAGSTEAARAWVQSKKVRSVLPPNAEEGFLAGAAWASAPQQMWPEGWKIELDEKTAENLRDWIGDGSPITLQVGAGHDGYGLYASLTEYPDEGAICLKKMNSADGGKQTE